MKNIAAVLIALLSHERFADIRVNGYEITLPQFAADHGIAVHRVPLRFHDPKSPYTLAVSTTIGGSIDVESINDQQQVLIPTIPYNFLATQVWPSARTAAIVIEKYMSQFQSIASQQIVICEFGCGPGLPSLTAALCHPNCRVIATDIDPLALMLVRQAAIEQNISSRVDTAPFDLVLNGETSNIPDADIYILSDVFENGIVAKGAAQITMRILKEKLSSKIWVFAQSDRAQREIYLKELQYLLMVPSLQWSHSLQPPPDLLHEGAQHHHLTDRLWLCNIDESNVIYG